MRVKEVVIWEFSCTGFSRNRLADWRKIVCLAFCRATEGTCAVCFREWNKLYKSGSFATSGHLPRQIFYPPKGEPLPNRNPIWRFVLLFRAETCYNPRATNRINGQGIWNLCPSDYESQAGIYLWNAYGFGLAWRLFTILTKRSTTM